MPIDALVFRIGSEEYAADASQVESVLRLPPSWASAPAPQGADGVAEVNGGAIAVFVPFAMLNAQSMTVAAQTRLIVTYSETGPKGIVVDDVISVMPVDDADVKPLPAAIAKETPRWLRGVITLGDRMLLVLDLCQYAASRERQLDPAGEAAL